MNILTILPPNARIHPLSHLYENKFVVFVSKSLSKNMPLVLNMLQQANDFAEINIGGKTVYAAAFEVTMDKAMLLYGILDLAMTWKGFSLFYNKRVIIEYSKMMDTLNCFMKASDCNDYKAHCNIMDRDIEYQNRMTIVISLASNPIQEKKQTTTWLIPCRKLYYARRDLREDHPATMNNQLQALAINQSCHWCPFLKIDDFKIIKDEKY